MHRQCLYKLRIMEINWGPRSGRTAREWGGETKIGTKNHLNVCQSLLSDSFSLSTPFHLFTASLSVPPYIPYLFVLEACPGIIFRVRADGNYCNKMKYSDTISPSQSQDIAADFHRLRQHSGKSHIFYLFLASKGAKDVAMCVCLTKPCNT